MDVVQVEKTNNGACWHQGEWSEPHEQFDTLMLTQLSLRRPYAEKRESNAPSNANNWLNLLRGEDTISPIWDK